MGLLLKNANKVNEGTIEQVDVLIEGEFIHKIASSISAKHHDVIDLNGEFLLPGVIDVSLIVTPTVASPLSNAS